MKRSTKGAGYVMSLSDRTFGIGVGVLVTALILTSEDNFAKSEKAAIAGVLVLVLSFVLSIVARRKQIAAVKELNQKELLGK